jgi:multidrug efflux pump subunit AcrB
VDQVIATGLRDPELQVEFDPVALANRGLAAADRRQRGGLVPRHLRRQGETGEQDRTAWLVRVVGQTRRSRARRSHSGLRW